MPRLSLRFTAGTAVPRARRRGFTLVELLITISIIAVMAGMLMFAMVNTQESARVEKTRALVTKLHGLVVNRYESYHTRRMPVTVSRDPTVVPKRPVAVAKMRVDMLRETMRMELPDRWTDIEDGPYWLTARPAINQTYWRRREAIKTATGSYPTDLYQGAECLYMIVTAGLPDEIGGRDLFREGDIGDVDKDGAPEFIDGWGNPIRFLRWAPGFKSELQTGNDPDPFDPRHVYGLNSNGQSNNANQPQPTYALYPLIYSPGPDQIPDIASDLTPDPLRYADQRMGKPNFNNNPFIGCKADPPAGPFTGDNDPAKFPDGPMGTPADFNSGSQPKNNVENWADNIHNHLIGTR